jgi:tetratricopeptide (TPR) repeat protein
VRSSVCALLLAAPLAAQAPRLGTIDFPTSGAPPAQREFVTGVLFLHSFEYERAAQAFRRAEQLDSGFAMAYWGEALTYTHPIWDEQNADAGRGALARLAPTRAARRARAPTGREQAYFDAVETLYGTGSKGERDTAYATAMARLVAAYPNDLEAKAFHALALLGLSQGVRDVPTYLRAAAIADTVFRANPNHPGAAHYIIHAYDDPAHARLGLAAARAYSKIAPDAAHAQHMTTHIFVALGLWDDVVAQNEIAQHLTHAAPGHYTAWLNYGYLQQGRHRDARAHLGTLRGSMGASPPRRQRAGLALIRAHYLVNTRQWDGDVARWSISLGDTTAGAKVLDAFVGGMSAVERGDRVAARQALATLDALTGRAAATSTDGDEDPEVGEIQALELRALLQVAASPDSAVALLRRAAALEDAMPIAFGPPVVIKPTHELLGEVLLSLRRPREAQAEFQRALALAPRRALSLLGLRRAAAAAGDSTAARDATRELRDVWHRADRLPELAELDQGYP